MGRYRERTSPRNPPLDPRFQEGEHVSALRWALALLLALLASPVFAQSFPAFTGYVVDDAHVLPADTAQALTAKLQALDQQTHRQLVVATIADLQGYPIEDYGYRLGRAWGVGQKATNNGAILIVAPTEHRVRIEVGYGLEPVLTDALSSTIIATQIVPRFKGGDVPGGIVAGTQAVIDQLSAPDADAKAKADAADAAQQKAKAHGGGIPVSLIFWLFIIAFFLLSRARSRGRRFGGGLWPIFLWGPGFGGGWSSGGSGGGWSSGGGDGGGFSGGGGGSFGGGGASGGW